MRNWNKTGKIKAVILVIICIPNLLISTPIVPNFSVIQSLIPLLFGSFALPLIIKVNSSISSISQTLENPNWNDNPLTFKRPLTFYQFGGWFMITIGTSMIIGTAFRFQVFQTFGFTAVMFGTGILVGIKLTIKWFK